MCSSSGGPRKAIEDRNRAHDRPGFASKVKYALDPKGTAADHHLGSSESYAIASSAD